jgi:hypothetical protein
MFHCCSIVVASCQCLYHAWCIGFHMLISTRCKRKTCGKAFDEEWQKNMGFKMNEDLTKGMLFALNIHLLFCKVVGIFVRFCTCPTYVVLID